MPGDDHVEDRKNAGPEPWRWCRLVGACALGAGLAWSAPALAGGSEPGAPNPGALNWGGVPSLQTAAAEPADDGLGEFLSEIRIGAMAHDVGVFGGSKEGGEDVNAELLFVSPDFLEIVFSPRPHIGVTVNNDRGTSQAYAGLTWDWTFWDPFFVEVALAITVHNGKISSQALDERSLGCRALFRESASIGARFLEHHSVSVMFAHISNVDLCDSNEGLDTLGVRYGYKF